MKALITGGAGFIGSHIADRLLSDGHEVIVLDDFSTGHRENLQQHDRLTVVEGCISDFALVKSLTENVNWIFHKAAVASVQKTIFDPLGSHVINYTGTLNILEAARLNKVERVVFASSAALYGDAPELPKTEDMLPVTLSPYAVDKLASEKACGMYYTLYGVETVCLRYFNVYGPRQDPSSPYSGVISIFADKLDAGQTPTIYGDGSQTRDFIYISDVVEANMRAVVSDEAVGRFMNVATGVQTTLNELLQVFCDIKHRGFSANYEQARKGDIRESYANIETAMRVLDWQPTVELRQGLTTLCTSEVKQAI